MCYMRAKNRKQKFLFILLLWNIEKISIGRLSCTVSKHLLSFVHADVADIRCFSKSAVDPKYCSLVADLWNFWKTFLLRYST